MSWVRSGHCSQCGECCKGDPFESDPDNEHRSEAMRRTPPVPGYCPLYEIRGDKGFCIGHETPNQDRHYLAGCNVWPDHPRNIEHCPSCTYQFTWQEE